MKQDVETVKSNRKHKIFGKEDIVKETQEGCLSRPIREKSELYNKVPIFCSACFE